ncbi:AAA family ATPase [Halosimplex litoreum]|uniref:AAA family ATPase n=1 Tax=Halosimplex litoreum TaxID=1198301 RepID=A0A7T3KWG7_9EURY|nr:MoxR family ATPase [Halosimplex litoreum]QPV64033.1 AAA family ATPase [Halosimplex litoreum]
MKDGVSEEIYQPHTSVDGLEGTVSIWGIPNPSSTWDDLDAGDYILFYTGAEDEDGVRKYSYGGRVLAKEENPELRQELWEVYTRVWGSEGKESDDPWDYIIYFSETFPLDIPSEELHGFDGLTKTYIQQSFVSYGDDGHDTIREKFGSVDKYIEARRTDAGRNKTDNSDSATSPDFGDKLTLSPVDIELPSDLFFKNPERLESQIEAALNSGKHVIFTGPPGTGKSRLARSVCEQVQDFTEVDGYTFTTATAEWSTFDTIGGYAPTGNGEELSFDPRLFLRCFRDQEGTAQNKWLVIDELNRADIDKAFGQLFSVLSKDSVELPYERENRVRIEWIDEETPDSTVERVVKNRDRFPVTPSWRLIATMNTYDKTSLYEMSYAFMRRFAFVRVSAPSIPESDSDIEDLMHQYADSWEMDVEDRDRPRLISIGRIWRKMNHAIDDRAIGPAIVKDMLEYTSQNEHIHLTDRLTQAIISFIFPQLEGVPKREQIVEQIASVDQVDERELDDAARDMLQVTFLSNE